MKNPIIVAFAILISAKLFASGTPVKTKPTEVTVYHSGALVTRTSTDKLPAGNNQIELRGISSKIVLNTLKIKNKEVTILNKKLVKKLTEEEYQQLLDRKETIEHQLQLIQLKYSDTTFITKVEELNKMIVFYSEQTLQLKKELRQVAKEIRQADELKSISLPHENAGILQLTISLQAPLTEPLSVQYVTGGVGWSPYYEIDVNKEEQNHVQLKYLAKIMSQTGENWENISLKLSSSFPLESPTKLPEPEPWLLSGGTYQNRINQSKEHDQTTTKIDELEGVEYDEILVPSSLKPRQLSGSHTIKSNSTVFTFPVLSRKLPATFHHYGFPGMDSESYLVAQITQWDTIGLVDGVANITYNGNDAGRTVVQYSQHKDTLALPIGKDNSIYLKREEIADEKYFKITSTTKKKKYTYAYQYQLKNNNPFEISYQLIDQVPISQTKSAEVEINNLSGAKLNPETGEVNWNVTLKPGESISKKLVFTIEMDANYRYYRHNEVRQKYQSMKNPRFI